MTTSNLTTDALKVIDNFSEFVIWGTGQEFF